MFINFTNHPCTNWGKDQIKEAEKYGELKEIPFPAINPHASKVDIQNLAEEYADNILALLTKGENNAVLCQGEYSFCFAVVTLLKSNGVKVLCACSERRVVETFDGEKSTKQAEFSFVGFREM